METLKYRVDCLEKDMQRLASNVELIMTNHLPHLQDEITKLATTMKVLGGLILAGITALILQGLTP